MKRALPLLLVLLARNTQANEVADLKKVPMRPPGTIVIVDPGKDPKRVLEFRLAVGAKRTITTTATKMTEATTGGETEKSPPAVTKATSTFEITSVSADGYGVIDVSVDGASAGSFEVTPRGNLERVVAGNPLLEQVIIGFPADPLGVGARWYSYESANLLGAQGDAVTAVQIKKADGDKIVLHLIRDVRVPGPKITLIPGVQVATVDAQNVADVTLDLSLPPGTGLVTASFTLELTGTQDGKPITIRSRGTASVVESKAPAAGKSRKADASPADWPLKVRIGDPVASVMRQYSLSSPPEGDHPTYHLADLGIWVFLNNGAIDEFRFDAPFNEPIAGVRVGDDEAALKRAHPEKNLWSGSPNDGATYMFRMGATPILVRYDLNRQHVVEGIYVMK